VLPDIVEMANPPRWLKRTLFIVAVKVVAMPESLQLSEGISSACVADAARRLAQAGMRLA